jgi:Cu/Ag efflux pump CusA
LKEIREKILIAMAVAMAVAMIAATVVAIIVIIVDNGAWCALKMQEDKDEKEKSGCGGIGVLRLREEIG